MSGDQRRRTGAALGILTALVLLLGTGLLVLLPSVERAPPVDPGTPGSAVRVRIDRRGSNSSSARDDAPEGPAGMRKVLESTDPARGSPTPTPSQRPAFPVALRTRFHYTEDLGPAKGLRIRARDLLGYMEGVTDASGELRFPAVEAGTVEVFLRVGGAWISVDCLSLTPGASEDRTFEIRPQSSVKGRVVAARDGRPLAGVRVTVDVHGEGWDGRWSWRDPRRFEQGEEACQTDAEGAFRIHGCFAGAMVGITARAPGYGSLSVDRGIPSELDAGVAVDLRLEEEHSLVPEPDASGSSTTPPQTLHAFGIQSDEGEVAEAAPEQSAPAEEMPQTEEPAREETKPTVEMPEIDWTAPEDASVKLRFRPWKPGLDLSRTRACWRWVSPPGAFTFGDSSVSRDVSAEGDLSNAVLSPGNWMLTYDCPGSAPGIRRFTLAAGENDLGEIVLGEGRTVSGRVLDPKGRELPGVLIFVGYPSPGRQRTISRSNKGFTIRHITEDSERIHFTAPDLLPREVPLDAGAAGALGDVPLSQGGKLRVSALGADGEPLAGWRVNIVLDSDPPPDSSLLDEELDSAGHMTARLPAGPYHLMLLRHDDEAIRGGVLSARATLTEGEETPVEIRLPR